MHSNKTHLAFTLPELLITLAVLAILITIALPSLARTVERNRNLTAMHEIHAQLQQARTHAILRKQDIELCPSKNGLQCTLDWKNWWLMRVRSSKEHIHYAAPHSGLTQLRWSGFSGSIRFHGNGTSPISNGRFYICEHGAINVQIVINRQGRVRWANAQENRLESVRCL